MAKKGKEFDPVTVARNHAELVRNGMYDTSRTASGIPFFIYSENGEMVPNPTLLNGSRVRRSLATARSYYIPSPDGKFPNGAMWSVIIPRGLDTNIYVPDSLFPNPEKQKFSTIASLRRTRRSFFDSAVVLIQSGDYKYGPNNTLVPASPEVVRRNRHIDEALQSVKLKFGETYSVVELLTVEGVVPKTPEARRRAAIVIGATNASRFPEDPTPDGRLERYAEELDPLVIAQSSNGHKMSPSEVGAILNHMVTTGVILSSQKREAQRGRVNGTNGKAEFLNKI